MLPPGYCMDTANNFWKETNESGLIKPLTEGSMIDTIKRRRQFVKNNIIVENNNDNDLQPMYNLKEDGDKNNISDEFCLSEEVEDDSDSYKSEISKKSKSKKMKGKRKRKCFFTRGKKPKMQQNNFAKNAQPASDNSSTNCPILKSILDVSRSQSVAEHPDESPPELTLEKPVVENSDDSLSELTLDKTEDYIKEIIDGLEKLSVYLKTSNTQQNNNNNNFNSMTPSSNGLNDLNQPDSVESFNILSNLSEFNDTGINFDDDSLSSLLEIGVWNNIIYYLVYTASSVFL